MLAALKPNAASGASGRAPSEPVFLFQWMAAAAIAALGAALLMLGCTWGRLLVWLPAFSFAFSCMHGVLSALGAPAGGNSLRRAAAARREAWPALDAVFSMVLLAAAILLRLYSLPGSKRFTSLFIVLFLFARIAAAACHLISRTGPAPASGVFVLCFLAFASFTPYKHHSHRLEGDEPYYLLLCHSILKDGDVNLENNYRQNDSLRFHDTALSAQLDDPLAGRRSRHPAALSVLLLPGYALGGRAGAMIVMNLLAALLVSVVYTLGRTLTGSREASLLASFAVAFTCPVFLYSAEIWPEVPAALFSLLLLKEVLRTGQPRPVHVALPAVLVVLLKIRFALIALPLVGAGILLNRKARRHAWKAIVPVVGGAAVLMAWNSMMYGRILRMHRLAELAPRPWRAAFGLGGLLMDHTFGLLPLAPHFALIALGLGLLMKSRPKLAAVFLAGVLPYLLLLAQRPNWYGDWAPPFRYLFVVLALLSPLLAVGLSRSLPSLLGKGWVLALTWSGFIVFFFSFEPSMAYSVADGTSQLSNRLALSLHADVVRFLPSFVLANRPALCFAAAGWAGLCALFLFGWRAAGSGAMKFEAVREWFSALPAVFVLLCVAAAGLAAAALTVPTRTVQLEHRQVRHTGGEPEPGLWAPARFRYRRNGWSHPPAASSTAPVQLGPGVWKVTIAAKTGNGQEPAQGFVEFGRARFAFTVANGKWNDYDLTVPLSARTNEVTLGNASERTTLIADSITFARVEAGAAQALEPGP